MLTRDEIDAPPAIRSRLRKLGLECCADLVLHLPLRYEDETCVVPIADAPLGVALQVEVLVLKVAVKLAPRRQLLVDVCDVCEFCEVGDLGDLGNQGRSLRLRFLSFYGSQQRALENARNERLRLRVFGEIRDGFLGLEMVHPRYRVLAAGEALPQSLTPVYPTTAGLGQAALRKLITRALHDADLSELLDADWCTAHGRKSKN